MQWLIDIFLEAARALGFCVDRGNTAAADFAIGDFTLDGAAHTLDLSGIIPAGVHGVSMTVHIRGPVINGLIVFRTLGNTDWENVSRCRTVVANLFHAFDIDQFPSADGKLEYWGPADKLNAAHITVKGWWY